jgi:hypothetical protein
LNPEGFANTLNKNSFAGAEWAIDEDEIASSALGADALSEVVHLRSRSNLHL